jgi:hypothetical protein
LNKFVGDLTLDEALEKFGLDEIAWVFRIEIEAADGDLKFAFAGWSFVADGGSHFALVHDLP